MGKISSRIKFISIVSLFVLWGCSPEDAQVNSLGAGDRWVFTKVSGDNQSTLKYDSLDERMVVQLKKMNGTAIEDEQIRFYLIYGSGQVQKPVSGADYLDLLTITDFEGKASAQFLNFGGDPSGISRVKAEVFDSTQLSVEFTIGTN